MQMYVGPWEEYKMMRLLDEWHERRKEQQSMEERVEADGQGLRGSSTHVCRLEPTGEGRPSCMEDPRDITQRRRGCMVYPMDAGKDVLVDLRPHISPAPMAQLSTSSGLFHNVKNVAKSLEEYPSGHYFSDVYPINFPRSHFASLPPLGSNSDPQQAPPRQDALLGYIKGEVDQPPIHSGRKDPNPILQGVSYLDPKTGKLIDLRKPDLEDDVRKVPLDKELLGSRASHRVVQRCCKSAARAHIPIDTRISLFGMEGKVLSEIEINKRIEERLRVQGLTEGRRVEGAFVSSGVLSNDWMRTPRPFDTEQRESKTSVTLTLKIPPSSPITQIGKPAEITKDLGGLDEDEDEANALLDWAQNLNPDEIA